MPVRNYYYRPRLPLRHAARTEVDAFYHADGAVNYARGGNPTWDAFEEALGGLEGGHALVHASGMGAISAALSLVPAGGTVVAPDTTYNGTGDLLDAFEKAGGAVRRRHAADTEGFVADLDGADLIWLESPTNPLMDLIDLPVVLAAAREKPSRSGRAIASRCGWRAKRD